MTKKQKRDAPMRDETFCRVLGNRIMSRMEGRAYAGFNDKFAELICGGDDSADAMTVSEAARFLRKRPEYCRTVLLRINLRVFGKGLSE